MCHKTRFKMKIANVIAKKWYIHPSVTKGKVTNRNKGFCASQKLKYVFWIKVFNHLLRNKVFWLIVLFSSYCDLSKIIRVNHEILGCIILAKLGPNFWFAPKGIFYENWLMLLLSTFCVTSRYKVFKKILIADHEIHGCIIFCQIEPKLSIHTNKELSGNID